MRVVEIAREIGLTTQELRHELAQTDFGVKSTDKDIPDMLAIGIVRFLSRKYKNRVKKKPKITKQDTIETDENADQETEKKKKLVQTIDSIKFIKPKKSEKEQNKLERVIEKKFKKDIKRNKETKKDIKANIKKDIKKVTKKEAPKKDIFSIESAVLQKTKRTPPKEFINEKGKKKIRITHKLTLDEVNTSDISSLEEEMITEKLERELVKEQKKKKSKSNLAKTKKDTDEVKEQIQIKEKSGVIILPDVISVKEFAEKTGIQIPKVISELMKNGIMATINQPIDFETASIIADILGVTVQKKQINIRTEDIFKGNLKNLLKDNTENLVTRPPIVAVMGHVDHGKTRLLDTIRNTNVIDTESGGITQHIGAYQIEYNGNKITFLDTPGHESFTSMRARGAKVTDIAILVVASDEGIKPQTIEAINHAREANVPIIVAITKIDKENSNIDKVKGELAEHDLTPEDWGGKTIVVPVSAASNENIDQLLEMILLVAELEELKGNPTRKAIATVIETHLDSSLGPMATIILNTGRLKKMDNFIVGETIGRVKLLRDANGDNLSECLPSDAVEIAGLNKMPQAGDILQVTSSEKEAKEKLEELMTLKSKEKNDSGQVVMQEIINRIKAGKLKSLKLILKADTKGSLEAIQQSLMKIESEKVYPKIIHAAVGSISESDVTMASASQAVVIGFNVLATPQVNKLAEGYGVRINIFQVIYDLINDVKKLLLGLVEADMKEIITGTFEVMKIFYSKKNKFIIGGKVTNGTIYKDNKVKVLRDNEISGRGTINNIKLVNENINEMREGNECGIEFVGNINIEEKDVFECYNIEKEEISL